MSAAAGTVSAAVIGATGYVGGEVLRLLAHHPLLRVEAAVARSAAGRSVANLFPHLRGVYDDMEFLPLDGLDLSRPDPLAVFACLPHGEGAALTDLLLREAEGRGRPVFLVDLSADFRLPDPAAYARVYGHEHRAPSRYGDFFCGLPDLSPGVPSRFLSHPGCFTTAVTLACAPLVALGLCEPDLRVSAVTGSTGSGREPKEGTHHPERHGNLMAYNPLRHRHAPEMEMLLGRLGATPRILFVPHSGPFARGIHATVHGTLASPMASEELVARMAAFYGASVFVTVAGSPPRIKDVVGSNRCHLSAAVSGRDFVLLAAIDNLVKGAAGGAIQWMNRLIDLPEDAGLRLPALGWN